MHIGHKGIINSDCKIRRHELAEHRMYEMCVEQAALSYKAHAEALKRIKNRISQLYYEQGKRGNVGERCGAAE